MDRYDIAIIGTGPAGVSAAITAKVRNKNILLIGSSALSEKMSKAHMINNYPGLPQASGVDLVGALKSHLEQLEIEVTERRVKAVYAMTGYFGIEAGSDIFEAKSIILATGVVQKNTLAGEEEFVGRGVSYCATCDGLLYRGKKVVVLGYSKAAEKEANYLAEIVGEVAYVKLYPGEAALDSKINVIEAKPLEIKGEMKADTLITDQGEISFDCIFILRESIAPDKMVPGIKIEDGHVAVDAMMATSIKGCFACGDIVGKPYQYIKAAGQGNVAALSAVDYLDAVE